jgi:hypothetical protein
MVAGHRSLIFTSLCALALFACSDNNDPSPPPLTGAGGTSSAGGSGGGGGGGGGGTSNATLSVKTAGGKGTISSAPGGINCGKVCTASIAAGTAVTLTATPEPGFVFVNWSGACTGAASTCTVTVNSSTTAQANFTK